MGLIGGAWGMGRDFSAWAADPGRWDPWDAANPPPPIRRLSAREKLGFGRNPKGLFGRGSFGHLAKGARNVAGMGGPLSLGAFGGGMGGTLGGVLLHGQALWQSGDNIFSPHGGYPEHLARGLGGWAGFDVGASAGAALGSLLGPVGTIGGLVIGGVAGGVAGEFLGGSPFELAEMGTRISRPFRSTFQDSEQAATMRQRSMEMIHRSHMNARSALGQEAVAFHL